MQTFEARWQDEGGLLFYLRGWAPDRMAKAVVALVHGHGEHSRRYAHVATAFTKAGYALVGFDLRGHGLSAGPRGHAPSYSALMDDLAAFLLHVGARFPKLPVFLYGHSLGGNLVLNFALRRKPRVRGVIASSPWLMLTHDPPAYKLVLARAMNALAPAFAQKSGIETAALSRDAAIVKAYEHDSLVHDRISARMFTAIYESGLWALDHAAEFPVPLLLMHGTGDRIASAEASRQFASRGGTSVTARYWKGWYHELHNEPGHDRLFAAMLKWMDGVLRRK
jgi:alpha-beta hydrolase superfamily lysophospholipase